MILSRLKEATRPYHDAIERQLDLINRILTRNDYALLLTQFYGLYVPLEQSLDGVAGLDALDVDLDARRKTPLLRLDLVGLGYEPGQIDAIPLCTDLPALESIAQALGCLYVLEGATLGGQFISRHLQRTLGIGGESGGRFFASYGPSVAAMWRSFGESLQAYSATAKIEADIVGSACDTFAAFGRWFDQGNKP